MNHHLLILRASFLLLILTTMSSCLALPQVETPIHESQRGRIILKTFPESFHRASHPSHLKSDMVQEALRGLRVQEDKALLATLMSGEGQTLPVFSNDDLVFFSSLIHEALTQATSEEYVQFEVKDLKSSRPKLTRGSLFLTDGLIHIGLEEFQADRRQRNISSKASFSPNRIRHWRLHYQHNSKREQQRQGDHFPLKANIGSISIAIATLQERQPLSRNEQSNGKRLLQPNEEEKMSSQTTQGLEQKIGELQQELERQNEKLNRMKNQLRKEQP